MVVPQRGQLDGQGLAKIFKRLDVLALCTIHNSHVVVSVCGARVDVP